MNKVDWEQVYLKLPLIGTYLAVDVWLNKDCFFEEAVQWLELIGEYLLDRGFYLKDENKFLQRIFKRKKFNNESDIKLHQEVIKFRYKNKLKPVKPFLDLVGIPLAIQCFNELAEYLAKKLDQDVEEFLLDFIYWLSLNHKKAFYELISIEHY